MLIKAKTKNKGKKMLKKILILILVLITIFYLFDLNMKLTMLGIQINEMGIMTNELNKKIENIDKKPKEKYWFFEENNILYINLTLKVTAYSSEICQTDSDPNIGAWNNRVNKKMVAVSRDLEKIGLTNGVPIIIEGYEHINTMILDRMGVDKTIKGEKIKIEKTLDIWMESKEEALKWGVKFCNIKVPIKYINITKLITKRLEIII